MKYRPRHVWSLLVLLPILTIGATAAILPVPGEYPTIQSALNASLSLDTVLIDSGRYSEVLTIPIHGITLAGHYLLTGDTIDIPAVVVRPPSGGRTLIAVGDSTRPLLRLLGITLRGGTASPDFFSGGIAAEDRTIEIRSCILDSCFAPTGGAINARFCIIEFRNSRIVNAGSLFFGMAFYFWNCVVQAEATTLAELFSQEESADACYAAYSQVELNQCTIENLGWDFPIGHVFIRFEGILCELTTRNCYIANNRFHRFYDVARDDPRAEPLQIVLDSNRIEFNEIQHDLLSSDILESGSNVEIIGNAFVANGRISADSINSRMFFSISGFTSRWTVTHNLFLNNESNENSVALIGSPPINSLNRFTRNYLIDDSCDGFANAPGGVLMMVNCPAGIVTENIIASSHGYAAFQGLDSYPPSHAPNNYWGHASGPRQSAENLEGSGDSVENLVTVTPWFADTSFLAVREQNRFVENVTDFLIGFAYPNPFNSEITIEFVTTKREQVRLEIFDLTGRLVETIAEEELSIGIHRRNWNAGDNASGIYFARLSAVGSLQKPWLTKLVLLK